MKSTKRKQILALFMAAVVALTAFGQNASAFAAESDSWQEESKRYDTGEKSDPGEDGLTAEDSHVLEDSAGEEAVPMVGEARENEELPLSAGEIESIQSNTAAFTIHLDENQDVEIIENGVDPENGDEGDNGSGTAKDSVEEIETEPADTSKSSILEKIGDFFVSAASIAMPGVTARAAEKDKDSMKVAYSGYASYCGHRMGIKYISESGDYKNHLVYCMDMHKNTTNGTVTSGGKIKAQITFCLVNGARKLGGKCHTDKYSSGSADADYFITSAAIHVLNGEVKLSYYNDGSGVYKNIEQMVSDAKNLNKSEYNLETGLTKSISYKISPKITEWKEVSEGLYRSSEKFVRTKSGSITEVKYVITGVPSGLTTGEIKKDSSDIVDEGDLKKYDVCVAQTDADKESSNFYLYCNEQAMTKILDKKSTVKVQAKAYSNEKGGRKWTPSVVSQQKITFLEEFTPVSEKAVVKVTSEYKPGSFSFQKTDKFNKQPIPGATYYLYEDKDCDDVLCEMVSSDTSPGLYGTDVQSLTQDTYYLKEIDSPEGYELDDTVYEISSDYFTIYDSKGEVTKKPAKTFTHEEYPEPAGVIINKKDSFSQTEIKNAGFAVFDDAACTKRTVMDEERNPAQVPVFYYDEDLGGAMSEKFMIMQDTYYVKEVEIPEGYKESGTVWEVQPKKGDVVQLNVENTPIRCDITADKKDSETGEEAQGDAALEGATYGLYAAEDIQYPDGSGIVTYKSTDPVTSSKGTDFQFMEVPAAKDTLLATVKTDKDSGFAFGNLYFGNYYVKEIEASEGYLLDSTVYDIKFREAQNVHQDISLTREVKETVKKQPFEIIKVSTDGESDETEKVAEAEFTVKLKSDIDRDGWEKAEVYDTLVTDENGYAKSIDLPYGTYLVKETKVPKDLYKTDDFTVTVTEDSREPQPWKILNDAPFKAYIRLVKKDKESGETVLLSGVTFKIKKAGSDSFVEQKVGDKMISEFVTDETGTVTTPLKLKHGEYEATEITAPEGYLLTKESVPFTVTKEGAVEVLEDKDGDPVITVEIENQPVKGSVTIHKEGEVLAGAEYDTIIDRILTAVTGDNRSVRFQYEETPLSGAVYHLIADEDIYTPDHQKDGEGNRKLAVVGGVPATQGAVVAVLTTDENGEASASDLPLGKYRIEEVQAPEGFVLDKEAKQIELTYADDHTEIVYENAELADERVKTELSLIKRNSVNEVPVAGAIYGVYATADIVSKDGEVLVEADSLIESAETDEEGKAVFEADLPLGRYYVKEIETAPGYLVDESEYEADFTYSDAEQAFIQKEIEVSEIPIIVEVSKSDMTTGKEIKGAKLEILDEYGDVYASWTTDGTPYTLNAIPAGSYTLRETLAPYGYLIANEASFTVREEKSADGSPKIQKVSMTDERVKGYIEIYKTDSDTKKAIKGAVFEIRDEKNHVIQKLETDRNGYAKSRQLDICTYKDNGDFEQDIPYIVVETKAADGYILDEKEHRVTIQYDDSAVEPVTYQLHVTNKPKEPKLPQTGGDYKPWMFGLAGGAFILSGIILYFRKRKRLGFRNKN